MLSEVFPTPNLYSYMRYSGLFWLSPSLGISYIIVDALVCCFDSSLELRCLPVVGGSE